MTILKTSQIILLPERKVELPQLQLETQIILPKTRNGNTAAAEATASASVIVPATVFDLPGCPTF